MSLSICFCLLSVAVSVQRTTDRAAAPEGLLSHAVQNDRGGKATPKAPLRIIRGGEPLEPISASPHHHQADTGQGKNKYCRIKRINVHILIFRFLIFIVHADTLN